MEKQDIVELQQIGGTPTPRLESVLVIRFPLYLEICTINWCRTVIFEQQRDGNPSEDNCKTRRICENLVAGGWT